MGLLHNGGFCNNCTPKRCLHILVHFQTKTPFSHYAYMKSPEFYENYILLFFLGKKLKVVEITISTYKQQLRDNTILSRALFRNEQ
jgi:hypothetical protein